MTTDATSLIARIAHAIGATHEAGLLHPQLRERLVICGAETMTLLEACLDLRAVAKDARFEKYEARARDAESGAKAFAELGLAVMRASSWHSALGGAGGEAVREWTVAVTLLSRDLTDAALARLARTGAPRAEAVFDLEDKVATVRIDLSALVDDWRADLIDDPARSDHGWPIVTGRLYGDPRCEDGAKVTLYGVPAADQKTMRGIHMTYDLGRKTEEVS